MFLEVDFHFLSIFCIVKNIASNLYIGFLITVAGHIVSLHLFSFKVLKVKEFHRSLTAHATIPCLDLPLLPLL